MDIIKSGVRKRCLLPAQGKKLCVFLVGSNIYYYFLYRNTARDLYLAYSTDGNTWDNEKLLVKLATGSSIANSASLAADIINRKIYIAYEEKTLVGQDIKIVEIDCTVPNSPSMGTHYTISGYATNYTLPVCALGYDGGLHVGALRFDFGGYRTQYYVAKSGISLGLPDLSSWSSIYNIGHCNHATYYGSLRLLSHPGMNRLVAVCLTYTTAPTSTISRSLNTTGLWNGWAALATFGLATTTGSNDYNTMYTKVLVDIATISGWGDAGFIQYKVASPYGEFGIYDFDGDTGGVGTFRTVKGTFTGSGSDVGICGIIYPGDFHLHCFHKNNGFGTNLFQHFSYSVTEDIANTGGTLHTGGAGSPGSEDRGVVTVVLLPDGISPSQIRSGYMVGV